MAASLRSMRCVAKAALPEPHGPKDYRLSTRILTLKGKGRAVSFGAETAPLLQKPDRAYI